MDNPLRTMDESRYFFKIRDNCATVFCQFSGRPTGYDRVRNSEIGNKDFELDFLEEAYTTEHWIVRIYKVKPQENRGQK
jgi:hypothetical protein